MFIIVEERKIWWPVSVPVPQDNGKITYDKFRMQFRLRDVDGNRDLINEGFDVTQVNENGDEKKQSELSAEFIEKLACDWKDVELPNKEALEYTSDNLRLVMRMPGVFDAIMAAYVACARGEKATRAGN